MRRRDQVFSDQFIEKPKKKSRNHIDLLITFAKSKDHCLLLPAIHVTLYSSKGGKSTLCNSSASEKENVMYVSNYPIMFNTST